MEITDAISLLIYSGFKVVLHGVEYCASVVRRARTGNGSEIQGANGLLPKGERLVVGENTTVLL